MTGLVLVPRAAVFAPIAPTAPTTLEGADEAEPVAIVPVQFTGTATIRGTGLTQDEQNNIEIYDRANKAVVYITTVTIEYSWMFEAVPREGTGSGVIIDQDGHVLTNYHVIKGADEIRITLSDGSEVEGRTIGSDPENDMAVLKFDPKGKALTTIPLGSSAGLKVGMKVLAIGNPFGFDRTLTTGIVSGLARPLQTEDGYMIRETIQTDAAINPGNSGGPLLNSHGELIGINSAIYSPSGASAGVGFAIPVNTARRIADELIRYGEVRRGWIDIDPIQLFPSLVSYFKLPVQRGVLVSAARTNALQAGIRGGDPSQAVRTGRTIIYGGGDIIVSVDKQKVESYSDLMNALEDTKPGEMVEVKVVRNGQAKTFSVKLVQRPSLSQ
ncbi:MAG: trypsin-like peptidase domain-containing protein [Spirochaetes bacterium]|nr:trypsin-like peptidase domain-containing protein [Spirochaetota bacterium]